jgi:hypothetical protein
VGKKVTLKLRFLVRLLTDKIQVGKLGTLSTDDRDREGETFTVPSPPKKIGVKSPSASIT